MASKTFYDIEKRSAKRSRAKFVMRYNIITSADAQLYSVITEDISSKSIAFESGNFISLGTRLDCEIIMPSLKNTVKVKGRVNRIEEIKKDKLYLFSMLFEEIIQEDKDNLEKYVQFLSIDNLLRLAVKENASDIHFMAERPPFFRINGELKSSVYPLISSVELKDMLMNILSQEQKENFHRELELDFSYCIPEGNRFRFNIYFEKGNLEATCRLIPSRIATIKELGLPYVVEKLCRLKKGLIIVTGPAGSGKTSTQAAMIDQINRERNCVIVSIEDPIEYIHAFKKSVIKQREVGSDTLSFASALKHVLRQDPNVILIGEMRDLDSISIAVTAAETGHLILATLHTPDAVECINRIVDAFPAERQNQIFSLLASCLEGVIAQIILPTKDEVGRVAAYEILIPTLAIRNLIRTGRIEQVRSYIETGSEHGMQTMDASLLKLVKDGLVDKAVAMGFAQNQNLFKSIN